MTFACKLLVVLHLGVASETCMENSLEPECMTERSLLGRKSWRQVVTAAREEKEASEAVDKKREYVAAKGADVEAKGGDQMSMESSNKISPYGWTKCYDSWGCVLSKVKPYAYVKQANYRDNCIEKECVDSKLTWDSSKWKPCSWPIDSYQGQCVPVPTPVPTPAPTPVPTPVPTLAPTPAPGSELWPLCKKGNKESRCKSPCFYNGEKSRFDKKEKDRDDLIEEWCKAKGMKYEKLQWYTCVWAHSYAGYCWRE